MAAQKLDPQTIFEQHRKARGDAFWEMEWLCRMVPDAVVTNLEVVGYVHRYEGKEDSSQVLSTQMRELIACVLLASKGEDKFVANHVRRLYRLGVTDAVIMEAFLAAVPVFGWATLMHATRAIKIANDPENKEGALPPGGAPKEVIDFPELHLGDGRPEAARADRGLGGLPEWQYIALLDAGLAERVTALYNLVYLDSSAELPQVHLPAAARELVAIAGLSARGLVDVAAQHVTRAIRYGVTPRQILEAVSAGTPMTGLSTVQVGAQAMIKAGLAPKE
ncbi:MAG: carboxymuconolactone decarboxylase family protein [Chloroflexi bacterium]|nr:carboxymuconolactone decarboxylase family protein [Chloroflexota bacterium]